MRHSSRSNGFTLTETVITISIAVVAAMFLPATCLPMRGGMNATAMQTKSLSNAKEIAKACILFAAENDGKFPDGSYHKGEPGGIAKKKSHECFTDIIEYGFIKQEYFFWNPRATHVCSTTKPNENGSLESGECAYEYVGGMTNLKENDHLPLVFEACTTPGTSWDKNKGHPWNGKVVAVECDGAGYIRATDDQQTIKVRRSPGKAAKEVTMDLVGAASATEGFPADAFYAPAK